MKSIYCIKEWIFKEKPLRHSVYCKLNVLRKFTVRKQILERFFLTLLVTKKKTITRSESQAIHYANDNRWFSQ